MAKNLVRIRLLATIGTLATVALEAQPALAQSEAETSPQASEENSSGYGDIIVTAQKRVERLNDVPISITALSGDQLKAQGINSPEDLGKVTPGFSFQRGGYGAPIFSIRGVGVYVEAMATAPTVSVYVDQTPLPYLVMTEGAGLDVARVEVLKGPQGTIFGQNSTGGAINYIAARPTRDFYAAFDAGYGRFNEVDLQGVVSGPINDKIRVRVAARHEGRDGYQVSRTRPDDRIGRRDMNQGRVLLDIDASEALKLQFSVSGWKERSELPAVQFARFLPANPNGYSENFAALKALTPSPDDPRSAEWNPDAPFRKNNDFYQLSARADLEATDNITLTSITAYSKYHRNEIGDKDGTLTKTFHAGVLGAIRAFSQELRAAVEVGRSNLTIGANYEKNRVNENAFATDYNASNSGIGPLRFSRYNQIAEQRVETYAAFASADVALTDQLTAQAGVRYTKQNRDFAGCFADPGDGSVARAVALIPTFLGQPYDPAPNGACVSLLATPSPTGPIFSRPNPVRDSLDQHNLSWRAGLNYKPSDDVLIYGNVTKGYKSGVFSQVSGIFADQLQPVTQESLLAYEVGGKALLLDRKLDISAAGFYYDYRDKQVTGIINIFPFGPNIGLVNVPKSRVIGAEAQVTARPISGLTLNGGVSYIDSKIIKGVSEIDNDGSPLDITGDSFPNAPKWQLIGNAQYDFPVSDTMNAFLGADVSYRSATRAGFSRLPEYKIDSYTLTGISFGLHEPDDRWRVQFWGRNIFNTFSILNVYKTGDIIARQPGAPATYGVTISAKIK